MAKIFTITAATAIVGVALYAGAGYVAVPYIVKIALERTKVNLCTAKSNSLT